MLTRILSFTLVIVALLASVRAVRAADIDKLLPSDTQAVLAVDVKHFMHAAVVKKHFLEPLQQACQDCCEVQDLLETVGLDPFKDIERVTIAATGKAEDGKFLVIIHGRFDTAQIQAAARELAKSHEDVLKIHKIGEHKMYEIIAPGKHGSLLLGSGLHPDKTGEIKPCFRMQCVGNLLDMTGSLYVGLVDKATLVVSGCREEVTTAFDKATGQKKTILTREMRHLVEDIEARQCLWMVMGSSYLTGKDAEVGEGEEQEEDAVAPDIESCAAGISLGEDLKVQVVVTAANVTKARAMMTMFDDALTRANALAVLLAGKQKSCAALTEIPKCFQASRKGHVLTLKGCISSDLFEKVAEVLKEEN